MKCTACLIELDINYKEHYKTELHQINAQRKIYCVPPLKENEYEKIIKDKKINEDMNKKIIKNEVCNKPEESKINECKAEECEKENAKKIIEIGEEKVLFSDGIYLTLENGKRVGNKEYMKYFNQKNTPIIYKERKTSMVLSKPQKPKKAIIRQNSINRLKISLGMNQQKYYREHWMQ